MTTKPFTAIRSILAAGVVCAVLGVILAFMGTPSSSGSSGGSAPTCAVRTSETAAPSDKATPFGGSGSGNAVTIKTPAASAPSCGPASP
jgi:hypothetical protein